MDFVSLATGEHRFLRKLEEILDDDDQAKDSRSSSSSSSSSMIIIPGNLDAATTTTNAGVLPSSSTSYENTPFLSKNAEAELYLLATNFLLYTALVIVVVLVCKLYFPEWLERSAVEQPRQFKYRVAEEQDYFDSEDSDGEDGGDSSNNNNSNSNNDTKKKKKQNEDDDDDDDEEDEPGEKWLEFKQVAMTKRQVLQRLILCSFMLNLTFVLWGVLQERMLTRRYPRYTGEYFVFSYALVFTNRFWTLILSIILWLYFKPRRSRSILIYEYSFPSISNMLSSWCQYEALRYVSFPATTLFKVRTCNKCN
jgi:UAA transporter family